MSVILPPDFDVSLYRSLHPDLIQAGFDDVGMAIHYAIHGKKEGRRCSNINNRIDFLNILPVGTPILEIRPGFNPFVAGVDVFYFETLEYNQLLNAAKELNVSEQNICEPDFVSPECDLNIINQQFTAVVSNNDLGKHPDLIKHLQQIEQILSNDGLFFCILPDKNYSFNYYFSESSITSVLVDNVEKKTKVPFRSLVEHATLITHNNTAQHWCGDHGNPFKSKIRSLKEVLNSKTDNIIDYNRDVQINSFSADRFTELMNDLYDCGLTKLKVIRNYKPIRMNNEFYVVLQKK